MIMMFASRERRLLSYLGSLVRHSTTRRVANLFQNEYEYQTRKTVLKSYPPQITVDITNRCPLHCPLCATGQGDLQRPHSVMPLDDFRSLVRQVAPRAFQVFLYCWGEPLLVKNIHEYIREARLAGLAVTLSSNLSVRLSNDAIEALVLSGPARILVSLDGLDAHTYNKYRVGGDFNRVVKNARRIAHTKARLGKTHPELVWQFLVFRHNEHQLEQAHKIYRHWGFDAFEIEKPNLPFGQNDHDTARKWFSKNEAHRLPGPFDIKDNVGDCCFWPWRSAVIAPDGGLNPCCYVGDPQYDVGNVLTQGFDAAWNSPAMVAIRETIIHKGQTAPCANCSAVVYKK